ncbi:mycofactocin-coupled SDR family oxidoreductase [Nocardioides sp.]|uniref:mycofactocin-coupled SDR family oxidoreductase n=1 Tax=Nocardioides sp. TaxID=35761 RepID=UPI003D0F9C25
MTDAVENTTSRRLEGRVAFISGAARGMGRSHAVSLAREGADIIAFDICEPVHAQGAPPSTEADLAETVRLVEALDRRIIATKCDARDHDAVSGFLEESVADLGRLDIVIANAGINGPGVTLADSTFEDWTSVIDTNLTGIFNVVHASLPHLLSGGRGGSIVMISSSLALRPAAHFGAYTTAKHGVVGLMKSLAVELGEHSIRVNTVHPTGVNTDLLVNESTFKLFRPDLEAPTVDDAMDSYYGLNLLPIPWVEASDVSRVVTFLASDDARYITGSMIPVDAGMSLK